MNTKQKQVKNPWDIVPEGRDNARLMEIDGAIVKAFRDGSVLKVILPGDYISMHGYVSDIKSARLVQLTEPEPELEAVPEPWESIPVGEDKARLLVLNDEITAKVWRREGADRHVYMRRLDEVIVNIANFAEITSVTEPLDHLNEDFVLAVAEGIADEAFLDYGPDAPIGWRVCTDRERQRWARIVRRSLNEGRTLVEMRRGQNS